MGRFRAGLETRARGEWQSVAATELIAGLPGEIATARKLLDWLEEAFAIRQLPAEFGPGNVLLIEAAFEQVTEIATGPGWD